MTLQSLLRKRTVQQALIALAVVIIGSFFPLTRDAWVELDTTQAPLPAEELPDVASPSAYKVVSVVDGDTIKVELGVTPTTVRIVGIDTPETVDPRRPVECLGREASQAMDELVTGKYVRLEADSTQADRDRYGRLLRFVFLDDGTDVGLRLLEQGYAQESLYSSTPHRYHQAYLDAQARAQSEQLGLWNPQICPDADQ